MSETIRVDAEVRLEDMRLYASVAEAKSFTAAAGRLGMPKQTLSRRIAQLELTLGVTLIHRTTRRLRLSDVGAAYAERCAECHGEDGLGREDGPAVWGPRSYNDGAGLAQVGKLASWLKVAMPLGDPSLTDQEALDIAAYVNAHERPKFVLEEHLPR